MVLSHSAHYKCSQQDAGIIRQKYTACSKEVKEIAHKTLICSKLEYCGAIWEPYHNNNIMSLEKVQCRAACFVTNYQPRESVSDMLVDLQRETLAVNRNRLRLINVFKETRNLIRSNVQLQSKSTRITRQTKGPSPSWLV